MITASIVTFHTRIDELDRIIDCIRKSPISHVYVIDNSSEDAIRDRCCKEDFITYIPSDNVGYAAGHNIGMRLAMEAGAVYHIVMNSDIYWQQPVIEKCRDYMDANPDVGQLMPKVYYPDGSLQYQCKLVPTPADLLFNRLLPNALNRGRLSKFQLEFTGYDHIMNVPFLSGCFMMFRVSALKEVGLFDERYFMYGEDLDMTRRMHERYKTIYYPEVSITHIYARSSHISLRLFLVHNVSMFKYFNKWGWLSDPKRTAFNERLLKAESYKG